MPARFKDSEAFCLAEALEAVGVHWLVVASSQMSHKPREGGVGHCDVFLGLQLGNDI